MLAIQVRLLTGRYVASEYNDRDRAEWPPHPTRLFAAAVSAWAASETSSDDQRAALEWWESLGAPEIICSPEDEVAFRSIVTHYVPVNDARALSRSADRPYLQLQTALADRARAVARNDAAAQQAAARAERAAQTARSSATALAAARGRPAPESALQVLPDQRIRQGRTYPSVTPADDVIIYRWPDARPDPAQLAALDSVLAQIARIGHSSSPVDVAVIDDPGTQPTYQPNHRGGELQLRTTVTGQLASLEDAYAVHQGREPRILSSATSAYTRWAQPRVPEPRSVFDRVDWQILLPQSRRPIIAALGMTRALRAALMKHAVQPVPPIISGHRAGPPGQPSGPAVDPHVAFLALPFVGANHADGSIQGLAVVVPTSASADDRAAVDTAIGRWLASGGRLTMGRGGALEMTAAEPDKLTVSVQPRRWSRPSRAWSSVTPVALDRHPGRLDTMDSEQREIAEAQARRSVINACANIGLPEPTAVNLRFDAPIRGTRPVRAFPPFAVGGNGLKRYLVHIDLQFAEPVRGPVILGAGRFFGYGLFLPTDRDDHGRN